MRSLRVKRTQVPENDHVLKNAHVLKRAEQRMAVLYSHSAIRISPRVAAIDCLLRTFGNNAAPLMAQRLRGSHPLPHRAEDLPHGGSPGYIGAGGLGGRAGAAGDTACPLERSRRTFYSLSRNISDFSHEICAQDSQTSLERFLIGGE